MFAEACQAKYLHSIFYKPELLTCWESKRQGPADYGFEIAPKRLVSPVKYADNNIYFFA